jgi:glycosyltransferase involved in cell wall biosynthesis
MSQPRLLVLCGGSLISGLEIMALSVMRGLRERGHEILCLTNAFTDGAFANRLRESDIRNASAHFGKFSKSLQPSALWDSANAAVHLPAARRQLRRLMREYRPEVVVAYNRDTLLLAADLLRNYPTIFHVHELAAETRSARWIYARLDRLIDAYAPVSHHLRMRLTSLGIDERRIVVIPNGIPSVPFAPRSSVNGRVLTVGIVGQIGPWKGHEDLFEALRLLRADGCHLRCAIFGAGAPAYIERLQRIAAQSGIAGDVEWRGFVRQLDEIYSSIDVCVMPSRIDETFGLAAAEAGARGIPVIATRRGGLSEVVEDGVTGYLVPDSSPTEIAERLRRLADDVQLRNRLGARARDHVLTHFSEQQMIDKMEALCHRVAHADRRLAPALMLNA